MVPSMKCNALDARARRAKPMAKQCANVCHVSGVTTKVRCMEFVQTELATAYVLSAH